MIKIKVDKGNVEDVEIRGTCDYITAECCVILRVCYDAIYENAGKGTADTFARFIKELLSDEEASVFSRLEDQDESK